MKRNWWLVVVVLALIALVPLLLSCQGAVGPAGPAGSPGTPGASSGTINGAITVSLNKAPLAGATVTTDPVIQGVTITSGADGSYSAQLPIGTYKLTFAKTDFTSATATVTLVAGQTATNNVALKPTAAVKVNAGTAQTSSPGAQVTLKATATSYDGSTVTGYKWTQTAGAGATMTVDDSDTITVTLSDAKSYKDELMSLLEPLDRFNVQAINPFALEEATTATFKATATTSAGTYSGTVNVVISLPYVVNGGLSDVPVGSPVLVHSKLATSYKWVFVAPEGSKAVLDSDNIQTPSFTPDVVGKYTIKDKATGLVALDIYAGTWAGGISGLDANGRPQTAGCTVCHDGKTAPDKFTAWKASGHAEIFTNNINDPAGHWSASCAACHTVGYTPGVDNGGFDEAMAAEGWKVPPHGEVGLYTEMLKDFPKTAALANIQCENCHGPNNSPLHANKTLDAARITLSAELCGACHGEPARHGRFQQWQESGHGNYELAIDESGSASCIRCHTAQGFLLWLKQGDLTKSIQGANGNATAAEIVAMGITKDTALPQTCVVCHEPHNVGTTTGEPTNARVRVVDNTVLLPSGYTAKEVGKGAICIMCHNTRNAVHNTDAPPTSFSAPHAAAQADVLLGENAYFVGVPQRSPHSYVKDTCVTCHMEATPPPAEFSYNLAGTNHSFGASAEICKDCHSDTLNAEAMMVGVEDKLAKLGTQMGTYLLNKMPANIMVKEYTPHDYKGTAIDTASDAAQITKANIASITPTEPHGQQGFIITLKSPVTFTYRPAGVDVHTVSVTAVTVRLGDITTDGTAVLIAATDNLVKAGWNYFLIHGDASEGIHNPAFINAVLDATIAALK